MADFEKIDIAHAKDFGVGYSTKRNPLTGELRARVSAGGVDVTITSVGEEEGGWQSSHSHVNVVETTTIIKGEVIAVEKTPSGALFFRRYSAGVTFHTRPLHAHNLLVGSGVVMSTLKLNDDPNHRDWQADPDLDAETKHLSWDEALEHCT